jgi:hypothetical protein
MKPACLIALLGIAAAGASCKSARANRESRAVLVGRASFPDQAPGEAQRGGVRFIVRGVGDISDDCPDAAARQFLAEYDGELVLAADGSFEARLVPFDPPVATPSGCTVRRVAVERIDDAWIEASVPALALEGQGWLDWQTLTSIDNDDLQAGSFDELHATIVFRSAPPGPR